MNILSYNPYYTYENIDLWSSDTWEARVSPLNHLVRYMRREDLFEHVPITISREADMTPDNYNQDRHCYVFQDTVDHWKEKGYEIGIGGMRWVVFAPTGEMDAARPEGVVLTVICDTDLSNPLWVMNMLEYYRAYCEMAVQEHFIILFAPANPAPQIDLINGVLMEAANTYNFLLNKMYLDVTSLVDEDTDTFEVQTETGYISFKDPSVRRLGQLNIPIADISGQWFSEDSMGFGSLTPGRYGNVDFSLDRLVHSPVGKMMADAMRLELDHKDPQEEGVQKHLSDLGLVYHEQQTNGRRWICLFPQNAEGSTGGKIPCMFILQEILQSAPHTVLSAFSLWYEYLKIAAGGGLMLIFFAHETPDGNDMIADIIKDAGGLYDFMDTSRVYLTGHSHNGQLLLECASRFPKLLAGVGTMGRNHGLRYERDAVYVTDRLLETLRQADMPLLNLNGQYENGMADCVPSDYTRHVDKIGRIESWNRRLYSMNCPARSDEEVTEAAVSPDLATRMLGVPCDRTEVRLFEGDECYIGDLINNEGRCHFRVVTIENLPHAVSPHMPMLTWEFLRRFRRDPETGAIEELF